MNLLEKKIVDTLKNLRENYHVIGVKAEFEAEGTIFEEAVRLKELTSKADLELAIKIGGCEAIKDLYEAKTIGVNTVIAPMIETEYAMKKYVNATRLVFSEEERENIDFYINVETITGYKNIENMVSSLFFNDISGVVLGRDDMTGSMGLSKEYVDAEEIFEIAYSMSNVMKNAGKHMVVGGGVSDNSLQFFNRLPYLSKFETRKIVFDAKKALDNKNIDKGIIKAIEFELLWLENKRKRYSSLIEKDTQRLHSFEARYKTLTNRIIKKDLN